VTERLSADVSVRSNVGSKLLVIRFEGLSYVLSFSTCQPRPLQRYGSVKEMAYALQSLKDYAD
jgi:hypothetical protein